MFLDRRDIQWGEEWRRRINDALAGTAFFVPVITPRYFGSQECRRELLTFTAHAESLGVSELVLPLLYVKVAALEAEDAETSGDEAVALVARTQYVDWTTLRLEDERAAAYRSAVNDLAVRLVAINEELSGRAVPELRKQVNEDDEPPGFVEIMAETEAALPRWQGTIESFEPVLAEINEATVEATAHMERSEAQGKGFAGKLVAVRTLANRLEAPAARVLELGTTYSSELASVDAGVLTLIRRGSESAVSEEDRNALCSLFEAIRKYAQVSEQATEAMRGYLTSLQETMALSRALRPALQQISDGVRRVADAQAIVEEWVRQIDASDLDCPPSRDGGGH